MKSGGFLLDTGPGLGYGSIVLWARWCKEREMERCIVTSIELDDQEVTITEYGPIWVHLWFGDEIQFDDQGLAIVPDHLVPLIDKIFSPEKGIAKSNRV